MTDRKTIYVYENWTGEEPVLMGILYAENLRGKEACSFEYADGWLESRDRAFPLDPDLQLFSGRQYTPLDKPLFGLFSDSCPDRWGRRLMERREGIAAKRENRRPRQLLETDYLLGVHDEARMGALRFSPEEGGLFLSRESDRAAPPWVSLRQLEAASLAFERDSDRYNDRWLMQLLAPGAALGGARPKVTVKAADGSLWIAKFPSSKDDCDVGAWEQVAHELAKACGLDVPESKLERFSADGSTYLTKRFDRQGTRRIHFSSALALLGKKDGASASDGSSYLELVEFIRAFGASPKQDLRELWKRIVFSMAVTNTDDHLRNHGFLLTKNGWRLSPLYDVNPNPVGESLALNVSLDDSAIDIGLAKEVAPFFGVEDAEKEAESILSTVGRGWRLQAERCGLDRRAQSAMEPAFALCRDA